MPIRRNSRTDVLKTAKERLIGQDPALEALNRYIEIYQAGLMPEGRPAGVFLLLGPTGTGKTHTVEVLAEALHGSTRNLLRVDCAEFQMEHEVAKLIGAPPGYLGHRETHALLNQTRINAVASEHSDLSIVLFDEIEKAAPSLIRLLLGILDRASVRLGDNSTVSFERCLIFLTSNLGARQMMRELDGALGLGPKEAANSADQARRLERQAVRAMKRHFSPEFVNRIDSVFTYQPLAPAAFGKILDLQIRAIQDRIRIKLGERAFWIQLTPQFRRFLLEQGTSLEYGARELKRVIQRHVLEPIAEATVGGRIPPDSTVTVHLSEEGSRLEIEQDDSPAWAA
ncbi:MAG: AAA family ATPase [Acidobacteria bacterium]|nr:AAA family ATPase [Acidobacteriota bacterium]